jgi:hypothetical protein
MLSVNISPLWVKIVQQKFRHLTNTSLTHYMCDKHNGFYILQVLSKVLEKIVHSKLYSYLETHGLLHMYLKANMTHSVLLDLSKAFDTINHEVLHKLTYYGIRGIALDLFKSYPRDRQHSVSFREHNPVSYK